jgi:putative solute:sodium symporter small subunit
VVEWAAPYAGLEKYSLKAKLLPFTLKADKLTSLTEEDKTKVPATMAKYLIHNQSFLTDFKFLGFPFHYFYTAVFLLILFVGLCWIYCYRTDKKMTKFEVVESA